MPRKSCNRQIIAFVREIPVKAKAKFFAQLSAFYSFQAKLSSYCSILLLDASRRHPKDNVETIPGVC
jgi:hypothetical protein